MQLKNRSPAWYTAISKGRDGGILMTVVKPLSVFSGLRKHRLFMSCGLQFTPRQQAAVGERMVYIP